MLDFTSALYLGLLHPSEALAPWNRLTLGIPAALGEPREAEGLAGALARLTGTEGAALARSTLHAFWDVFGVFAERASVIHVDAGSYPISRGAAERAKCRGVPVRAFLHHDARTLHERLARDARAGSRPIVVVDGLCPGCGGTAPLRSFLETVREFGGRLVVDDTQALGVLGRAPGPNAPYGTGGGGSLRWHDVRGPEVMLVSSLAKGFGAPAAMVAGSDEAVTRFKAYGEMRAHGSPPSIADLRAARSALDANRAWGDVLRLRLASLVVRFREGLRRIGFGAGRSLFPVQTLDPLPDLEAADLHRHLERLGVRTVLHRPSCRPSARVSFLITARHTPAAIDRALEALAEASTSTVRGPGEEARAR